MFTVDVIAAALSPPSHLLRRMFYFGFQPQKLMMENEEREGERDAVRCLLAKTEQRQRVENSVVAAAAAHAQHKRIVQSASLGS